MQKLHYYEPGKTQTSFVIDLTVVCLVYKEADILINVCLGFTNYMVKPIWVISLFTCWAHNDWQTRIKQVVESNIR